MFGCANSSFHRNCNLGDQSTSSVTPSSEARAHWRRARSAPATTTATAGASARSRSSRRGRSRRGPPAAKAAVSSHSAFRAARWPRHFIRATLHRRRVFTRLVFHLRSEVRAALGRNGTCRNRGDLLQSLGCARARLADDPLSHDYAYALQVLPSAAQIDASSIGALQHGVLDHVAHDAELRGAARGALAVLAGARPPQGRAAPKRAGCAAPKCSRRSSQVLFVRSSRRAASRRRRRAEQALAAAADAATPRLLLASLARVGHAELGTWPRADAEAGLADVDIAEDMPSSVHRKLLGASCAGIEVDSDASVAHRGRRALPAAGRLRSGGTATAASPPSIVSRSQTAGSAAALNSAGRRRLRAGGAAGGADGVRRGTRARPPARALVLAPLAEDIVVDEVHR